jgi:GNAT superfamily N-acetyltransferase
MNVSIRTLAAADFKFALELKEQAGWNQTRADIERFSRLAPEGCFLAEWEGRPAGTAVVFEFGPVAWIAMMLVEKTLRGRGIGRALMEHALAFAESRGAASIRLDATPLGQPLYEKLGFTADYALTRYGGVLPPAAKPRGELPTISIAEAATLDRLATGADRRSLLEALWEEQSGFGLVKNGKALGFHAARPGSIAAHIGPCLAEPAAGAEVLQDALNRRGGQSVFLDVPEPNPSANEIAQAAGLLSQRLLLRMTRGPKTAERVEFLWTSSGPEKG